MITHFHVENYKALRNVSLDLTPMHVLIGPNDSGKTSILEAMAVLCRSVQVPLPAAFEGAWNGFELVWKRDGNVLVKFGVKVAEDGLQIEYNLSCKFLEGHRALWIDESASGLWCGPATNGTERKSFPLGTNSGPDTVLSQVGPNANLAESWFINPLWQALRGVESYRWIPSHLALPVAFQVEPFSRMESSGFGLALMLADLLGKDRKRYEELEHRLHLIFPNLLHVNLHREPAYDNPRAPSPSHPGYRIYFELTDIGQELPASQVSDGILLILAYLAILYSLDPPRLLLIEEPENGIHPVRLREVLKILKESVENQSHTQIVLTTHSPYVVDLFQPEEVTLCQRNDDGAVTTRRLSESKAVREQVDIFSLGEIWTAEGDEALATQAAQE